MLHPRIQVWSQLLPLNSPLLPPAITRKGTVLGSPGTPRCLHSLNSLAEDESCRLLSQVSPVLVAFQSFLLVQSLSQLTWPKMAHQYNCSRQDLRTYLAEVGVGEGEGGSSAEKMRSNCTLVTSYALSRLIPFHSWRKRCSENPKVT